MAYSNQTKTSSSWLKILKYAIAGQKLEDLTIPLNEMTMKMFLLGGYDYTAQSKNLASYTEQSKNTATLSNQTKKTASYTNISKS